MNLKNVSPRLIRSLAKASAGASHDENFILADSDHCVGPRHITKQGHRRHAVRRRHPPRGADRWLAFPLCDSGFGRTGSPDTWLA